MSTDHFHRIFRKLPLLQIAVFILLISAKNSFATLEQSDGFVQKCTSNGVYQMGGQGAETENPFSDLWGFVCDVASTVGDFFSGWEIGSDAFEASPSVYERWQRGEIAFGDDSGDSNPGAIAWLFEKIGSAAEGLGRAFIAMGGAVSDPVNVVNGVFYQDEVDLRLEAPEAMVITRSYLSSSWAGGDIGASWRINHDYYLFVNKVVFDMLPGSSLSDDAEVRLGESDGTVLVYSRTSTTPANRLFVNGNPDASAEVDGLNNYNSNGIGGASNLKNNWVEYEPASGIFTVHRGDGTLRSFQWRVFPAGEDDSHPDYRRRPYLVAEQKPGGTKLIYDYTDAGLPSYIKSVDSMETTVFNWIKFEYSPLKRIKALVASDGRRVSYYYNDYNDLVRVVRPDHTEIHYEYEHEYDEEGFFLASTHRIIRVEKPNHRLLVNEYYQRGDVVDGLPLSTNDFRIGRVKLQKAPVEDSSRPVANALFKYYENADGSGLTELYDILGNKTTYRYNSLKLLTAIEKYTKSGVVSGEPIRRTDRFTYSRYSLERRYWDASGNLDTLALEDSAGIIQSCKTMSYDSMGNLLTTTEWGNLSGDCAANPILDNVGKVQNSNELESAVTTYTYGEFNLPVSSTAPNGAVKRMVYEQGRGLLVAEYVCSPDSSPENPQDNPIVRRRFYSYNAHGILTEMISDDGTTEARNNLIDVTQRTGVDIGPGTGMSSLCLPESITNKYWNGAAWSVRSSKKIDYNGQGLPVTTRVYDADGILQYSSSSEYDPMGRVVSVTDPFGSTTLNFFDDNGNLVRVDGPRTDLNDIVETDYDFFDRPVASRQWVDDSTVIEQRSDFDGFGNELCRTDAFGNVTEMKYDDLHRLVRTILPEVADLNGSLYHPETGIEYDSLGRSVRAINAEGETNSTAYNVRGQIIRTDAPDGTWTEYRYNLDGTLARKTASTGHYSEYTYDFMGRVTSTTDFAPDGTVLSSASATFNAFSQTSFTDALDGTTTNIFDWSGRLIITLGPEVQGVRSKVETIHDDFNRVAATKTWFGNGASDYVITTNHFDHAGRVMRTETINAAGEVQTAAASQFDAAGNRTVSTAYSEAAPDGAHTIIQYNALNQVVKITDPLRQESSVVFDYSRPGGIAGIKTTAIDANTNQVITIADALGRVVLTEKRDASGALQHYTDHAFDEGGRLTRTTEHVFTDGSEVRQVSNVWNYNAAGQLLSSIRSAGCADERTTGYEYYPDGMLRMIRKPNGVGLLHFYDNARRLKNLTSSDGSVHYEYGYNAAGKLLTVTDHVHGVDSVFTYDVAGRKDSETTSLDGFSIPVEYAHNRAGAISRILLPGQNAVDYEYSASGLHHVIRKSGVTSVGSTGGTENYRHTYASRDASGNLLSATSTIGGSSSSSSYTFDELGRRQSINAPSWSHSVAASGAFDAVGNLQEYSVSDPLGSYNTINGYDSLYRLTDHQSAIANQQFTYDSVNNRLSGPAEFNSPTLTYGYNELNELTGAMLAGNLTGIVQVPVNGIVQPNAHSGAAISSITVQLDQNTPISATLSAEQWEVSGGTLAVPVDGQQHTITVNAVDSAGKQNTKTLTLTIDNDAAKAFIHDLNGNLIQQTVYTSAGAVETTGYQYDALDRLRFAVLPSGGSIEYRYDALHRRISKTVDGSPEYYLWLNQSEIGCLVEDAGSLALTQFRILGAGMGNEVGAAVAVELRPNASSAWNVYEPVHDHRGNIAVLLYPNGSVAESYRYDAYGNVKIYDGNQSEVSSSAIGNPWQFSSKRTDSETGLLYFGRRYYAPTLARFSTTDPAGFADGPNLYAYVGGNPIMYVDPDGRLAKDVGEFGAAGIIGTWNTGVNVATSPLIFAEQTLFGIGSGGDYTRGFRAAGTSIWAGIQSYGRSYEIAKASGNFLELGLLMGYQVPVFGNYLPCPQAALNDEMATLIQSRGINGASDQRALDSDIVTLQTLGYQQGVNAESATYTLGSAIEVLSALFLGNTARGYEYADQVRGLVGDGATINQVAHSGGVIRSLQGSKYLGYHDVGVNRNFSYQGPALGIFNNVQNLSLNYSPHLLPPWGEPTSTLGTVLSLEVFSLHNTERNYIWNGDPHYQIGALRRGEWDSAARSYLNP